MAARKPNVIHTRFIKAKEMFFFPKILNIRICSEAVIESLSLQWTAAGEIIALFYREKLELIETGLSCAFRAASSNLKWKEKKCNVETQNK